MINKRIVLGIDTSNYTTSAALMYEDGELIANIKKPLPVKNGECGLRQSDAVFAHVKNMPDVMNEVREQLASRPLSAVGVSTRPRNVDGSYMPCFLAGVSVAESIACVSGIPIYRYSHQCGHIMAAIYSSKRFDLLSEKDFCAFHVSGGTTEMLKVKYVNNSFSAELIGETLDLNAGQVIDRLGVYMGFPFPAGAYLEKAALENRVKIPTKKPKASNFKINLSGLENMAKTLYDKSQDKSLTSAFVLDYIEKSLSMLAEQYEAEFGKSSFVFAGGVMSNSIIRNNLESKFDASFAEPVFSSDNAVGIARLTVENLK